MKYIGKIKTGLGEGKTWMKMAEKIFRKKYNTYVYLGTLNIELEQEIYLSDNEKILPHEYGGNLIVLVQECKINGHKGYIVRTEKNNKKGKGDHPLNIIEVVSDINFRDTYNLKDGDEVYVDIDLH